MIVPYFHDIFVYSHFKVVLYFQKCVFLIECRQMSFSEHGILYMSFCPLGFFELVTYMHISLIYFRVF